MYLIAMLCNYLSKPNYNSFPNRFMLFWKVYVHDSKDVPQVNDIGKSVLPGTHTLATISHIEVTLLQRTSRPTR